MSKLNRGLNKQWEDKLFENEVSNFLVDRNVDVNYFLIMSIIYLENVLH